MSKKSFSRRKFIVVSLGGAASGALGQKFVIAARPKLSGDDPMAKALGYAEDATSVDPTKNPSYTTGNDCSNCAQFRNPTADGIGDCALFPGKGVPASAWCKAWVK